jgi:phytoene desaturase
MNVIQHLEINLGTYMSTSGMYGVVNALYQLALDEEVKFTFNTEVTKIIVENNSAKGVIIGDNHVLFDAVISNMDIHHTYEKLLPEVKRPTLSLKQPRSNSVIVLNWAMTRSFDELGVHNIFFANDEKTEYNAIEQATISDDPSAYVYISSKIVKEDAPSGCENWFLLISVPHNDGQDWDTLVKRTNENCKTKISRMLGVDVASFIAFEHALSPDHIANNYLAYKGAVFGNSANGRFAAFLRHPNFRRTIKNLYFSGGTVHPGAGIPMCLNSAKIVEGMLDNN